MKSVFLWVLLLSICVFQVHNIKSIFHIYLNHYPNHCFFIQMNKLLTQGVSVIWRAGSDTNIREILLILLKLSVVLRRSPRVGWSSLRGWSPSMGRRIHRLCRRKTQAWWKKPEAGQKKPLAGWKKLQVGWKKLKVDWKEPLVGWKKPQALPTEGGRVDEVKGCLKGATGLVEEAPCWVE